MRDDVPSPGSYARPSSNCERRGAEPFSGAWTLLSDTCRGDWQLPAFPGDAPDRREAKKDVRRRSFGSGSPPSFPEVHAVVGGQAAPAALRQDRRGVQRTVDRAPGADPLDVTVPVPEAVRIGSLTESSATCWDRKAIPIPVRPEYWEGDSSERADTILRRFAPAGSLPIRRCYLDAELPARLAAN